MDSGLGKVSSYDAGFRVSAYSFKRIVLRSIEKAACTFGGLAVPRFLASNRGIGQGPVLACVGPEFEDEIRNP
jgi:hypothetical protein